MVVDDGEDKVDRTTGNDAACGQHTSPSTACVHENSPEFQLSLSWSSASCSTLRSSNVSKRVESGAEFTRRTAIGEC